MYKKYFQLTKQFTNSFPPFNNSGFLGVCLGNYGSKRWAGHSKWQNIKSTKQAMDQAKSAMHNKLSREISAAVKKGGGDMISNPKLKTLWEDALKINMPKVKFEDIIKKAKSQESDKPYWTVFSGPRGFVLGFEVLFANKKPAYLKSVFGGQVKKLNLKLEPYYDDLCTEKGIIITDPLPSIKNSHEKAVEDAIEIGIEEVFENDDKNLIFECPSDRIDQYQQKLEDKGYNILSASTELEFKQFVKLEQEELQNIETLISKLKKSHEEIIRATYNVLS